MIVQVLLFEKRTENKLKKECINGIFSDGARMAYQDEVDKLHTDKRVILNTATFEWNEAMEKIFSQSYNNLKMTSDLPGVDKTNLENNGGVLGTSIAFAVNTILLHSINTIQKEDIENKEIAICRAFELDLDFFRRFNEKSNLTELLTAKDKGIKKALETLLSDYDHIYIGVFGDSIDKLNELVDGD